MLARISEPNFEQILFRRALAASLLVHIALAISMTISLARAKAATEQTVYSVTLEGGKSLGGISQTPKTNKTELAPPKNTAPKAEVQEKKEPEKKPLKEKETEEKKLEEKPELALKPKKTEPKKEPKKELDKPQAKPQTKPAKKEQDSSEDLNKRLQQAIQRYSGESNAAGGKGFGAARLGGSGFGGGVIKSPEFFAYKRLLENHIWSGWSWYDKTAALVAQVEFAISSRGELSAIRLASSSGNSAFDDSVLRAVEKANPVPVPPMAVYEDFKLVRITFDPRE